ncbi:MAG: aminotransferase class V-fold PLP-dependent enzyme [Acidobacteria bacterium]|nr:aminotransferase class V-fold PLP-dependent enzyme [Acidobacteriota bacterium]
MTSRTALLLHTAGLATKYLETIADRHVGALASGDDLRRQLAVPLSDTGEPETAVIDALALAGALGTVATQGPRYYGFVVGGSVPAATAADWLVSAWDQNAGVYVLSPVVSVVEDITAVWLKDLAGLPAGWSTGFVTGCQAANFTALATARQHMLTKAGWDVEANGLYGAPWLHVVCSEESHYTIFNALKLLGLGAERVTKVPADEQGRMRADELARTLDALAGPTIVCAQAGNVNSGAFDPIDEIATITSAHGAWLHVDGAFGLWAAASPARAHLVKGIARADSVATDAHKWLNVPYDSGVVFTAHPASHRRAMTLSAAYIIESAKERDPHEFVPEESRRARAVPVYAAVRSLGRHGLGDLVERCCQLAARLANQLRADSRLAILNDVVLNQVLVRLTTGPDPDAATRAMVDRLQQDGTCWASGTTWHGMAALRVSISNWSTTEADVDRTANAITRCTGS